MKDKTSGNRKNIKLIVFFVCWTFFVVLATSYVWAVITDPNNRAVLGTESKRPLIEYINELRASKSLQLLRTDPQLTKSAQQKADDLAAQNYFDHIMPNGKAPIDYMQPEHPGLKTYGENLAKCYPDNKSAFDAFVAPPKHYANIVLPEYTLFGSATTYDKDQHCYIIVNHFGAERS